MQATGVELEGEAGETSRLDQDEPEDVWTRLKDGICSATAFSIGQQGSSTAHPIDLLSDDQVDRLLFDDKELSSIFRTDPAELAAFERIKVAAGDWPAVSAEQRNAEFIAFANSVSRDRAPKRKKAVKRSAHPQRHRVLRLSSRNRAHLANERSNLQRRRIRKPNRNQQRQSQASAFAFRHLSLYDNS